MQNTCPNCNEPRAIDTLECVNCGIIYERYEKLQQQKALEEKQTAQAQQDETRKRQRHQSTKLTKFLHRQFKKPSIFCVAGGTIAVLVIMTSLYYGLRISVISQAIHANRIESCHNSIAEQAKYDFEITSTAITTSSYYNDFLESLDFVNRTPIQLKNISYLRWIEILAESFLPSLKSISGTVRLQNGFNAWTKYRYFCYGEQGIIDNMGPKSAILETDLRDLNTRRARLFLDNDYQRHKFFSESYIFHDKLDGRLTPYKPSQSPYQ